MKKSIGSVHSMGKGSHGSHGAPNPLSDKELHLDDNFDARIVQPYDKYDEGMDENDYEDQFTNIYKRGS